MSTTPTVPEDAPPSGATHTPPTVWIRILLILGLSGVLGPIVVFVGICVVQIRAGDSPFDPFWATYSDGPWHDAAYELLLFWLLQPFGLFLLALVSGTVAPHSGKGCAVLVGLCLLSAVTFGFIAVMCM